MAQKTTVVLVDDLDGGEAEQTVEFGLDGVTYELDLSEHNAAALRDALADYVSHARRQGRTSRRAAASRPARTTKNSSSPTSVDREQNKAIRDWARQHGYQVSDRGRIPSEVTEAYHRAS